MNCYNRCKNSLTSNILRCRKFKMPCPKINLVKHIITSCGAKLPQTTLLTHPHLLKLNEVTHEISRDVYRNRRQKFIDTVRKVPACAESFPAQLVVIPSGTVVYMSQNIPYSFRQNTDFLYLCGHKEPNCILVLTCDPDRKLHKSILFIPKQTAHSIKWEGPKMDLLDVTEFLGIDQAFYITEFENFLQSFAKSFKKVSLWYDYLGNPFQLARDTMKDFITTFSGQFSVETSHSVMHQLRLIKSNEEIELMRKSCRIAADSMNEVMKYSSPNVAEAHLQAKMEFECRLKGADYSAFPAVVAGGERANIIHYIANKNIIRDNELVLMDAGCEYHGYASDMARTWPVNGKFTDPQKELYELLLEIQEELIKLCNTELSLDELFQIMCKKLGIGLQGLNIISKTLSDNQLAEAAFELCPHHVSHYLGMDVHDTGLISRNIKLQPGMVVTVEPGVYISKNLKSCPEKYRGLGIRIEDDVLITEEGNEVLTSNCVKHVDKIEEFLKK